MSRLLVAGLVLVVPVVFAPAAPVPKHLMPKAPPLYYPTSVGAKWEYDLGGGAGTQTLVVTNVEPVDEGRLVTVEQGNAEGVHHPWHKMLVSRDGLAMTEESGEAYTPRRELLRAPFRPRGERVFATKRFGRGQKIGMDLRGKMSDRTEEEVRVPAGVFRALRVESEWSFVPGGQPTRTVQWFAVGIGVVKQDSRVLKSFTPGKD